MRRAFFALLLALSLAACASRSPTPTTAPAQPPVFAPRTFDGPNTQPCHDTLISEGSYRRPRCPITNLLPQEGETPEQTIDRLMEGAHQSVRCDPLNSAGAIYILELSRLAAQHHICNGRVRRARYALENLRQVPNDMAPPITIADIDRGMQLLFDACGPTNGGSR